MTFIAQLVWFQKRLFESNFDCLPVNPRVFLVCSHAPEDPNRVVAKLLMENLYLQGGRGSARNGKVLDPRAMFIVQSADNIWLWIGSKIPSCNIQEYKNAATQHIKLLQANERSSSELIVVEQGNEGKDFWKSYGLQEAPSRFGYDNITEWDHLFIDVSVAIDSYALLA